ncbi:hypothetical protein HYH03_004004 [Edaphochlamys debaryana]|uniref:Uncharacterized protein n=1 Tax=Edaphochlamys debaryana TaxID=47281 RepID=A0A835YAR5_9CHLO|nr:hypothetical protein HYH03_004004 [Edaphochlamys debaryana]|eukprot:KAG2498254.1 hypothetical protein HYH03_004004 [Edaphochlamys debaryana]
MRTSLGANTLCGRASRPSIRPANALRSTVVLRAAVPDIIRNSKKDDLLFARTPTGGEWLHVAEDGGDTLTARWKGQVLRFTATSAVWDAERIGSYPPADGLLAQAFPELQPKLAGGELHDHAGAAPAGIAGATRVYSLAELEAAAAADASLWCDGTVPGAPEKTPLQALTLTAGELVSLMQGKRGIVIVQLWNGFDPSRGQPLYEPWVAQLLEAALGTEGVRGVTSVAPGGVGLTAVLYADKEPWNAWGPHLASFGCQANAVAGSPYYKLLVGRILGYREEAVHGYVRALGGGLTPALIAQVDADLKRLSKAKPKLPWNKEQNSRGKKKEAGAGAGAGASKGAGAPGGKARGGRR